MTEIEAAKNNSSNRRPKHRSVKDRNVEGRNSSRYFSLPQYRCCRVTHNPVPGTWKGFLRRCSRQKIYFLRLVQLPGVSVTLRHFEICLVARSKPSLAFDNSHVFIHFLQKGCLLVKREKGCRLTRTGRASALKYPYTRHGTVSRAASFMAVTRMVQLEFNKTSSGDNT